MNDWIYDTMSTKQVLFHKFTHFEQMTMCCHSAAVTTVMLILAETLGPSQASFMCLIVETQSSQSCWRTATEREESHWNFCDTVNAWWVNVKVVSIYIRYSF